MGYIAILDERGRPIEVLGDEVGKNQARKEWGMPHQDKGRHISQRELDAIDKEGR